MTTTNKIRAAATSRGNFSFHRVSEIAMFYRPQCVKQLMVYGLASLLFAILMLLPLGDVAKVTFFTICWAAIPLLYAMAPVVLGKSGDARIIERLIPASPAEKFCFFALYFWLAVPISVYLLPYASNLLYLNIPSIQTKGMTGLIEIQVNNPPVIAILNSMSILSASVTCLYVILKAKSSRVVKAVISVFAVQFGIGLLAGLLGGVTAFGEGFADGYKGEMNRYIAEAPADATYSDGVNAGMDAGFELAGSTVRQMIESPGTLISLYTVVGVYLLLMLFLTYRHLKRANL